MTLEKPIDVYALGNALVDILAFVEDEFVGQLDFPKGSMNLVDTAKRTQILQGLSGHTLKMTSGGSAANSIVAILQSGGSGIFAGKVADDEQGAFYAQDMRAAGARYEVPAGDPANDPTGTSIILTTPDAERTMCTHLGISIQLGPEDVLASQISQCKICYIEGYLWTGPDTKAAALKAMALAKEMGTKVSFTFSDAFLVNAFAQEFKDQVLGQCDIVFCNSDEARSFTGMDALNAAAVEIGKIVPMVFITDGKNGAVVVEDGTITEVEGFCAQAIDTVGAGDSFAGGVLYALANGYDAVKAARWGNRLASKVVEVRGPRLASVPGALKVAVLD